MTSKEGIRQLGESIGFTTIIIDSNGAVTDVATITISIKQPDTTMAVTTQNMVKIATGTYYYDFTIPAEPVGLPGVYKVRITVTGSAGKLTIQTDTFEVEESI